MERKRINSATAACRRFDAGFTLIEVLLVVVIIGVLLGMAIPRLSGRVEQAKQVRAQSDIDNISTALRLYEVDNGRFPAALADLTKAPANAENWRGPYLEKGIPKDPWNNEYRYQMPGTRNPHGFDLWSLGPDGVESADDIGNWPKTE